MTWFGINIFDRTIFTYTAYTLLFQIVEEFIVSVY